MGNTCTFLNGYDTINRLTDVFNKTSLDETITRYEYTYDQVNDLVASETVTNGPSPLTPASESIAYANNNLNQLEDSTPPFRTYAYDDDGNMTTGYTPDGCEFTAAYGAENRLKSLEYTDALSVVHKTEYFYRADGFLDQIKKYEDETPVSDIRIVRNGFLPIQDRDGANTIVRQYAWGHDMGGGIGGLLDLKQGGQSYSYLYDGKGNVVSVIDGSENVVAEYAYGPFGEPWEKIATIDQSFRFSTKRYDEQTGLSYYGYRFYSPHIGKWLTRDPLGEAGGTNLYAFVDNNPLSSLDFWGLKKREVGRFVLWLERKHTGKGDQDHVHWVDKHDNTKGAINRDGTLRHGKEPKKKLKQIINKVFRWNLKLSAALSTLDGHAKRNPDDFALLWRDFWNTRDSDSGDDCQD